MNSQDTAKILLLIHAAYPRFEVTDDRANLWAVMMEDIPFDDATAIVLDHIWDEKYPPTIADITGPYTAALEKKERREQEELEQQRALHPATHFEPMLLGGDDD